jgi:ubiquinone biosynthesis protein COQ9
MTFPTELHQITSPSTAYTFLEFLLDRSASLESSLDEINLFATYLSKSCTGIFKSSGIF